VTGGVVSHHAGALGWHAARSLSAAAASALPSEIVRLDLAIGRVLAADVVALCDVPHYASSAMDGWAVCGDGPWVLSSAHEMAPGRATAVVTGGLIPERTDAVLRSESGVARETDGGWVLDSTSATGEPHPGQHIRPPGQEARESDIVLTAGTVLNPAHIAVAAGCGHDTLPVIGQPRIALLFTGDEVVESGIPKPGQVRDSFGPQLPAVLRMLGGTVASSRRVRDDLPSTIAALGDEPGGSDVVITTGGTGDSPVDHLHRALRRLGAHVLVERVAMRPGGPSLLARLPDGRMLIGLPGNPLAAMMGLVTLVGPLLAALGGRPEPAAGTITAATELPGRPGTSILVPYRVVGARAVPSPWLGSGMMRGLAAADGVLVVPPDGIRAGETVDTLALPWAVAPLRP
jgi:molybdopterin molybdotransferase